jgi:hypothetical protein
MKLRVDITIENQLLLAAAHGTLSFDASLGSIFIFHWYPLPQGYLPISASPYISVYRSSGVAP